MRRVLASPSKNGPTSLSYPSKKRRFMGPTESSFPCPNDPVPDAPIDYTELWKAVSMTKPPVIRNLLYRRLNEAATSSRKMADNAAVKTYLNKLIEDIRKFIKQLESEGEDRHAM